jgi:hypothetical protein
MYNEGTIPNTLFWCYALIYSYLSLINTNNSALIIFNYTLICVIQLLK